jgi:hypothetical protein
MWKKLPALSKKELSGLLSLKKAKLYADEDIEDDAVEFLRDSGANIKSARELGRRGKPDTFHAALAFKEKRFLLTKNAKHYMDDKIVPFQKVHGIIAIDGDMGDMNSYTRALLTVLSIVPYGEVYAGMKIRVSRDEMALRFINADGKMTTARMKTIGNDIYEWVEQSTL